LQFANILLVKVNENCFQLDFSGTDFSLAATIHQHQSWLLNFSTLFIPSCPYLHVLHDIVVKLSAAFNAKYNRKPAKGSGNQKIEFTDIISFDMAATVTI
jgi:hypothetical protein